MIAEVLAVSIVALVIGLVCMGVFGFLAWIRQGIDE